MLIQRTVLMIVAKSVVHARRHVFGLEKVGCSEDRFRLEILATGPAIKPGPILSREGTRPSSPSSRPSPRARSGASTIRLSASHTSEKSVRTPNRRSDRSWILRSSTRLRTAYCRPTDKRLCWKAAAHHQVRHAKYTSSLPLRRPSFIFWPEARCRRTTRPTPQRFPSSSVRSPLRPPRPRASLVSLESTRRSRHDEALRHRAVPTSLRGTCSRRSRAAS